MQHVNKSQIVEVVVPGAGGSGNMQTRINFPDMPQLREKFLNSLETFCSEEISSTTTNNPVIDATTLEKAFLVLYLSDPESPESQGEYIQLPLVSLHRTMFSANTHAGAFILELPAFKNVKVQWPKCYILLASGIGNADPVSFLFTIYYSNKPAIK